MRPPPERLEIIAQPYYPGKLRYRSTYESEKSRRAALQSRNNLNYKVPAVRVSSFHHSINFQYTNTFRLLDSSVFPRSYATILYSCMSCNSYT